MKTRQTKAQLQEANENLNKIIRQQGKQLKELREDYDLAARRLDGIIQKDFLLYQYVEKIKSIADVIDKNKSPLTKYWGLSWTKLFVGVAILAHIVTIYVLIGSA